MSKTLWDNLKSIVASLQTLAGVVLFVAPWLFGFTNETAAAWTAWVTGAAIGIVGIAEYAEEAVWPAWVNLFAGLWAILAPWLLEFAHVGPAMWTQVVAGVVVAGASIFEIYAGRHWTTRIPA